MFSFFGPTLSPTLSRPAGRERELTALFGRVFKEKKYAFEKYVGKVNDLISLSQHTVARVLPLFMDVTKYGS